MRSLRSVVSAIIVCLLVVSSVGFARAEEKLHSVGSIRFVRVAYTYDTPLDKVTTVIDQKQIARYLSHDLRGVAMAENPQFFEQLGADLTKKGQDKFFSWMLDKWASAGVVGLASLSKVYSGLSSALDLWFKYVDATTPAPVTPWSITAVETHKYVQVFTGEQWETFYVAMSKDYYLNLRIDYVDVNGFLDARWLSFTPTFGFPPIQTVKSANYDDGEALKKLATEWWRVKGQAGCESWELKCVRFYLASWEWPPLPQEQPKLPKELLDLDRNSQFSYSRILPDDEAPYRLLKDLETKRSLAGDGSLIIARRIESTPAGTWDVNGLANGLTIASSLPIRTSFTVGYRTATSNGEHTVAVSVFNPNRQLIAHLTAKTNVTDQILRTVFEFTDVEIRATGMYSVVATLDGVEQTRTPYTITTPGGANADSDASKEGYLSAIVPSQSDLVWRTSSKNSGSRRFAYWPDWELQTPFKMGGKQYSDVIQFYTHTIIGPGNLNWTLNGKYQGFQGLIGIDDGFPNQGDAVVTFFGDEQELAQVTVKPGEAPQQIKVNVKGLSKLRIHVRPVSQQAYINFADSVLPETSH